MTLSFGRRTRSLCLELGPSRMNLFNFVEGVFRESTHTRRLSRHLLPRTDSNSVPAPYTQFGSQIVATAVRVRDPF